MRFLVAELALPPSLQLTRPSSAAVCRACGYAATLPGLSLAPRSPSHVKRVCRSLSKLGSGERGAGVTGSQHSRGGGNNDRIRANLLTTIRPPEPPKYDKASLTMDLGDSSNQAVVMAGRSGTGKTHLAMAQGS